jgi:hypothetical protein
MAGISTHPVLSQRADESRPLRSLTVFSCQGLLPAVDAFPPNFPEVIRVIPRFLARVFTRPPVALRLRFGLLCEFPSPPTLIMAALVFKIVY